jgi:hypothetical protein
MSLFQRLLGIGSDTVASELRRRIAAIEAGPCRVSEALVISVFGPAEKFNVLPLDNTSKGRKEYQTNGALFELCSYLYMRADVYLFTTHPRAQDRISTYLRGQFRSLFQKPLGLSDSQFTAVANDRQDFYAALVREDPNARKVHSAISIAIHDTIIAGGKPRAGISQRLPMISALDDFSVKQELIQWEMDSIPQIYSAIDKAVEADTTTQQGFSTKSADPTQHAEKIFHFALLPPPAGEKISAETMRIAAEAWEKKQSDSTFSYGVRTYKGADVIDVLEADSAIYWRSCLNCNTLAKAQVISWLQALEKQVGVPYLHTEFPSEEISDVALYCGLTTASLHYALTAIETLPYPQSVKNALLAERARGAESRRHGMFRKANQFKMALLSVQIEHVFASHLRSSVRGSKNSN